MYGLHLQYHLVYTFNVLVRSVKFYNSTEYGFWFISRHWEINRNIGRGLFCMYTNTKPPKYEISFTSKVKLSIQWQTTKPTSPQSPYVNHLSIPCQSPVDPSVYFICLFLCLFLLLIPLLIYLLISYLSLHLRTYTLIRTLIYIHYTCTYFYTPLRALMHFYTHTPTYINVHLHFHLYMHYCFVFYLLVHIEFCA